MTENTYTLDGDVLADGRYFFRVTASDRPSNPADLARQAELVSAPVLIDNTPPVVTPGAARRVGSRLEIDRGGGGSRIGFAALRIFGGRGAVVAGGGGGRGYGFLRRRASRFVWKGSRPGNIWSRSGSMMPRGMRVWRR